MMRNRVVLGWVMLSVLTLNCADRAQARSLLPDHEIVRKFADERARGTQAGIVIIDAVVKPKSNYCTETSVTFGRRVDGKLQRWSLPASSASLFGQRFGGIALVPAGEYFVLAVACKLGTGGITTLNGPHAKFQVATGETVNVGSLTVAYESDGFLSDTGKLHRSVDRLGEKTVTLLKEKYPQTFGGATYRPMTVVGGADATTRKKYGF
jgi:hypothetical protein